MTYLNISDLSLGEAVYHEKLGKGVVIACTEKPSVKIKFASGETKLFTEENEKELLPF